MISRNKIKCPECGGEVNSFQPCGIVKGKVIVLVECWSGSTSVPSKHHWWTVAVPIAQIKNKKAPSEYNMFASPLLKEGKSIVEVAKLWREYKKQQ